MAAMPRRSSIRHNSLVVDNQGIVWIPSRRASALSAASAGIKNVAFEKDTETDGEKEQNPEMLQVHFGHDPKVRRGSVHYMKKELEIDYHVADLETLYARYGTHPKMGLKTDQIKVNGEKYGLNILTTHKRQSLFVQFLKTIFGGFQLLLLIGSCLSFIGYIVQRAETGAETPPDNLYLGCVLAMVVLTIGSFEFAQEYSSGKVMESFAKMVPSFANVVRNGKLANISADELVVGDIVQVKFGDKIPADIRIIQCSNLKVDNSSLTGESEPQSRSPNCTDENPTETKNLAFFSTYALEGNGTGVVVGTGDNTFIGRIAGLAGGMDLVDTPLSMEISNFVKIISVAAISVGIAFFCSSLAMGHAVIDSAIFFIGILVAVIPVGLQVTLTVILALTAKRMAGKNCLVRQLQAVETLGSCSVICTDKTGTLTQNKMTASHMWFNKKMHEAAKEDGEIELNDPGFKSLARVAALCSNAKFLPDQENLALKDRKVNGDASETAILRCMQEHLEDVERFASDYPKVFEIPFNSTNKWQLSVHMQNKEGIGSELLVAMKGAPERIMGLCSYVRVGEHVMTLDDAWREELNSAFETIGEMGERVIGFAEAFLPPETYNADYNFESDDNLTYVKEGMLTFTGLISMVDPPRPGVPDSVRECRSAGIKVVMVTGDHPITAKAIAKKVGLMNCETVEDKAKRLEISVDDVDPSSCQGVVVSGAELIQMSAVDLDDVLKNHTDIVFARVSPEQKLIIVEGFQRLGQIVAVTGDGVNDSPALKKADIGVAMGISGSDVSKQAADMILMDDNFNSIVLGVEQGRLIFENLKKCICYLMPANMAELIPFLLYITISIPLPLGTIPMLIICLGTDVFPTISLSYEPPEGDTMKRPPRDPVKDKLVTFRLVWWAYGNLGVIEAFAGMVTYFIIMGQNGFWYSDLLWKVSSWDDFGNNNYLDFYGQEWTYYNRKNLEKTCWTGYFCTVVVCQWANVIISKVRRETLFSKRFFSNSKVFMAIVAETTIACVLAYTPYLNIAVSYRPILFNWWLPAIPWFFVILFQDEIRRWIIRNCTDWTWYKQEFYY